MVETRFQTDQHTILFLRDSRKQNKLVVFDNVKRPSYITYLYIGLIIIVALITYQLFQLTLQIPFFNQFPEISIIGLTFIAILVDFLSIRFVENRYYDPVNLYHSGRLQPIFKREFIINESSCHIIVDEASFEFNRVGIVRLKNNRDYPSFLTPVSINMERIIESNQIEFSRYQELEYPVVITPSHKVIGILPVEIISEIPNEFERKNIPRDILRSFYGECESLLHNSHVHYRFENGIFSYIMSPQTSKFVIDEMG